MKNFKKLAMLGAVALTSTVLFTACSSDEDVALNPTYDGSSVKTSFTLSVGDVKNTRMAATAVQENGAFQGMTDIYLFPAKAAITGSTVASEGYINLPDFNAFDANLADAHGKVYKDVNFSLGVSNFLFYAAIANDKKDNGELKPSYLAMTTPAWAATQLTSASTIGSITFDLVPYQKDKALSDVKTAGATTLAPLNAVDAAIADQITAAASAEPANIKTDLQALQKILRNDKSTTSDPNYKVYAGSSPSMLALMESLYNKVAKMNLTSTDATPVNYGTPILTAIATYFNVDDTNAATTGYELAWKTDPNFPASLNVPDGAVAVQFAGSAFDFVEAEVDGMIISPVSKYVHPARLYYTINTPAMVKDAEYLATSTDATWEDVKTNGDYAPGAVQATTQSVIMQDEVQYAVGRLDVKVRVAPSVTIKDSGSGIDGSVDEDPQPVAVPTDGYTLTGVLIGGQNQVDWAFEPVAGTDGTNAKTIWDNAMTTTIAAKQQSDYSAANHTLALATKANNTVNIALEFTNTSDKAFYGVDHNIIPAGGKFYLVAKLTPGTNEKTNPNTLTQVFKQDYITTALLTIHETALAKAYNVIPDLRSPKLEFGLSVNLEWEEGITFEQTFQ